MDAETTRPVTAEEAPAPARPRRGYFLPGTIALVVLAVLAVVIEVTGQQSRTPSTLTGTDVATGIAEAIQVSSRPAEADPPDVRCPAQEPERRGLVFDCTLVAPGHPTRTIRVTETSSSGLYRYEVVPAG
jgi:hypothetical protein